MIQMLNMKLVLIICWWYYLSKSFAKPTHMKFAKEYLKQFGYLDDRKAFNLVSGTDEMEFALREFQKFHGLKTTGGLSDETIKLMETPRCGLPDKDFGKRKRRYVTHSKREKKNLTYKVMNYTDSFDKSDLDHEMRRAFSFWMNHAPVFVWKTNENPDFKISFKDIGGPEIINGYGYYPPVGVIEFEQGVKWKMFGEGDVSFLQVAVHETGHALGIKHMDKSKKSVMYPYYQPSDGTFGLSKDDIAAIQFLYGKY